MTGAVGGIDTSSVLALRAQILDRNAALSGKVAGPAQATGIAAGSAQTTGRASFDSAITAALGAVNATQAKAGDVSAAFERGDTVDIAAVMLARQKASIAFEATLQVRNKLLSAYHDVMSMPV